MYCIQLFPKLKMYGQTTTLLTPLTHYPVLKEIMGNLDFQDLLTCREVCTQWNSVVSPLVRYRVKLVIDDNKIQDFLGSLHDHVTNPVHLPETLILKSIFLKQVDFLQYAHQVTSLVLYKCEWEVGASTPFLYQFLQLKSFTLNNCQQYSNSSLKSSLALSISCDNKHSNIRFPFQLSYLDIRGDHLFDKEFFTLLLSPQNTVLKSFAYKRTSESADHTFGNFLLKALEKCNLKLLESLKLDISFGEKHFEIFQRTIELKKLSVDVEKSLIPMFVTKLFPLINLQCLELGIIGYEMPPDIIQRICIACSSLDKIAVHCPSYPRIDISSFNYNE